MPKSITTFCTASRSHLAVKTRNPYVWVSEDVLSETFTAFVRNHKRSGSNVPGPLEARKRAAKRRATHLAHQSATNYSPESFGLFDTQSQHEWWQKPESKSEEQVPSSPWPFSLRHVIAGPPPPPPRAPVQESELDVLESKYGGLSVEDVGARLRDRLHQVHTHTAAMGILAELSIQLSHTPDFANTILKHMIAERWNREEIAEYLLDPWSNTAGTENHVFLLEHAQEYAELIMWLLRRDVFAEAARLGLIAVTDIQKILLLAPKTDANIFPESATWVSFCIQLLDAVDDSKVLSIRDLEVDFMQRWLEEMPLYSFCPTVPQLLWRLQSYVSSSCENSLENVVYTSLSMAKQTTLCHLHGLVDFMASQPRSDIEPVILSLTYRLCEESGPDTPESLSTTFFQQRVDWLFRRNLLLKVRGTRTHVTTPFVEDMEKDDQIDPSTLNSKHLGKEAHDKFTPPDSSMIAALSQKRMDEVSKLELWYAVLGNFGSTPANEFGVSKDTLRKFFAISRDRGDAQQRSLSALWVAMVLSVHDNILVYTSGVPNVIKHELHQTFLAATEIGREHILANICRSLQMSPLPAKNKLLRRLHALSKKSVDVKRNYWDLSKCLNDLDNARILELRNDLAYGSLKQHFPNKLIEIAECLNTDMAKFEQTCIDIIKHAKGSINIVFRLLHNNKELKVALRKAGAMKSSDPDGWTRTEAASQVAFGGYSYLELVRMIHNFAREISRSQQLSPRNALRRVYLLRGYLLSCQAPINLRLARAMWHAGVTRFEQERAGSCYNNVRWLYKMIKTEYGWEQADQILRGSGKADVPNLTKGPKTSAKELVQEYPWDVSVEEEKLWDELQVSDRFNMPEVAVTVSPFYSTDNALAEVEDVPHHPQTSVSSAPPHSVATREEVTVSIFPFCSAGDTVEEAADTQHHSPIPIPLVPICLDLPTKGSFVTFHADPPVTKVLPRRKEMPQLKRIAPKIPHVLDAWGVD